MRTKHTSYRLIAYQLIGFDFENRNGRTMLSSMASMTANLAFPCELINLEKACALVKLAATSQSLNQVLNNSQTWFILLASLTVVCKSTFVRNGLQTMRSSFPSGNKRKRGEDEARTNKKSQGCGRSWRSRRTNR